MSTEESAEDEHRLDSLESFFLWMPLMVTGYAWLMLSLVYLGIDISFWSAALGLIIVSGTAYRFLPAAMVVSRGTLLSLGTICLVQLMVILTRPPNSWPIQYDGAYHVLQALVYSGFTEWGVDYRPPLLPVLLGIEINLTGDNWTPYGTMQILSIMMGMQAYLLALALGKDRRFATLAAVLVLTAPVTMDWGSRFYHDVLGATLLCSLANLYLHGSAQTRTRMLVIGFIAGCAALTKYSYIFLLGLVGFELLRSRNPWLVASLAGGLAIAVAPFLLYHGLIEGDPIGPLHKQLDAPVDRVSDPVDGVGWSLGRFSLLGYWMMRSELVSNATILLAAAGMLIAARGRRWSELSVVGALLIPHLAIYSLLLGYGEARYLIAIIPFSTAFAALAMKSLSDVRLPGLLHRLEYLREGTSTRRWFVVLAVLLFTLPLPMQHLQEGEEHHFAVNDFDMLTVELARSLRGQGGVVMSAKDLEVGWYSRLASFESPSNFNDLAGDLERRDVDYLITRSHGGTDIWGRDIFLCLDQPYLTPRTAVTTGSSWAILWDVDLSATANESSVLDITSFIDIRMAWHGHAQNTTDHLADDLLVVRHYDDVVRIDPSLGNATSLELEWLIFRFDAWPGAYLEHIAGGVDLASDDRFYAYSSSSESFARAGPWVDSLGPPAVIDSAIEFSPKDYGNGGSSGVHVVRLVSITY